MPRRTLFIAGAASLLLASAAFLALKSQAADHNDAPGVATDAKLDINDIYAFRSPANSANLVIAATVNPFLTSSPSGSLFSTIGRYQFHVDDDDADLLDDVTVTFTFSDSAGTQQWRAEGLGVTAITGQVTRVGSAPIIYDAGGIKIFCGLRDDPFFFDLAGFQMFVAAPHNLIPGNGLRTVAEGTPVDRFVGLNIAAIVIELPITALGVPSPTSGTIKAWFSTARQN
ncbi:MAG TPA: DUF4331 family protein [Candidatus Limnocylindria bacterium]|nr:DUF4331 family protein [Candidatus Limnocylindria bacterium]